MAANTNILTIEGRLTHDPTITKTQKGISLCKFSIANNRYYYRNNGFKNDVSFFDVVIWGTLADEYSENLKKAGHILIHGQLRQDSYMSKMGEKKQSIYILASNIEYLDKKAESNYNSYNAFNSYAVADIGENVVSKTVDHIDESLTVTF